MKNYIALLLILVFLTAGSCNDFLFFGNSDSQSEISDMNLEETAKAIDKEVGEARAKHISQCDILPIGAKPCGGPWGYLVYSGQNSSESTLKKLIERYDKLDKIRNTEEDRFSTCEMAAEPTLTIENGSCKGEGSYAWNPGHILERNGIEE